MADVVGRFPPDERPVRAGFRPVFGKGADRAFSPNRDTSSRPSRREGSLVRRAARQDGSEASTSAAALPRSAHRGIPGRRNKPGKCEATLKPLLSLRLSELFRSRLVKLQFAASWFQPSLRRTRLLRGLAPGERPFRQQPPPDQPSTVRPPSAPASLNLRFGLAGERPRFIQFPPPGK